MNLQNNSQKQSRSKIWIIATIWANIIIVVIILTVVLMFLNFIIAKVFGLSGLLFTQGWLWKTLIWVSSISAFVYAIRLGVKSALKKSVILQKDIIKISVGVAMVTVALQLIIILLSFSFLERGPTLTRYLQFIGANIGYFVITYFWCKKLIQ